MHAAQCEHTVIVSAFGFVSSHKVVKDGSEVSEDSLLLGDLYSEQPIEEPFHVLLLAVGLRVESLPTQTQSVSIAHTSTVRASIRTTDILTMIINASSTCSQ